jgi:hypothetical protein
LSNLSTIQFSLAFKDKRHKPLEYCWLVIHLTSVSTISYAESNGGIFILIAPLCITNTKTNVLRVSSDCQQHVLRAISQQSQFRLIFKGHKGPLIIYDWGWAGKKRGWVMRYFWPKKGGHLKILVQKGGVQLFNIVEKKLTCNDYCYHRERARQQI